MKRIFLPLIGVLLFFASLSFGGALTNVTCTFGVNDNVCYMDTYGVYKAIGNGTAMLFVPAAAGRSGKTLTLAVSHDNTTFYTAYVENGDTAIDTFPGDNTVNKAFGITLYPVRYWRFTTTDNTFNSATLVLTTRD